MRKFLFYILSFIFIYALALVHNTIDMDFWARIIQGNAFWSLGHILKQDPFSYTQTHIWLDHEWGASVIFSFIQNHFGYLGITLFRSLLSLRSTDFTIELTDNTAIITTNNILIDFKFNFLIK